MRTRVFRLMVLGVIPVAAAASLSGCAEIIPRRDASPLTRADAVRVEQHGLAVEFVPSIDRYTYFGAADKSGNMLHVTGLDRPTPADGGYTFFGGCYTWIAPQKPAAAPDVDPQGRMGWIAPDGSKKDWPPDPAMDVGPVRLSGVRNDSFTVTGPEQRSGLQEIKTFTLIARDLASLSYSLTNRGTIATPASCWVNTAATLSDRLAVRLPPGTSITGWDQANIDSFQRITSEPDARGWALVDLSRADWAGGIKVYLHPSEGSPPRPVEIAVWRSGARQWLHRSIAPMSAEDAALLRRAGEGPVAVYIQPDGGKNPIIEAELYGPIRTIEPGQTHTTIETWRLIASSAPDVSVLP